jgi:hypothetical protein
VRRTSFPANIQGQTQGSFYRGRIDKRRHESTVQVRCQDTGLDNEPAITTSSRIRCHCTWIDESGDNIYASQRRTFGIDGNTHKYDTPR